METGLAGKGEYLVKPNIHHYHLNIFDPNSPIENRCEQVVSKGLQIVCQII